jgi:hypothetical protein
MDTQQTQTDTHGSFFNRGGFFALALIFIFIAWYAYQYYFGGFDAKQKEKETASQSALESVTAPGGEIIPVSADVLNNLTAPTTPNVKIDEINDATAPN